MYSGQFGIFKKYVPTIYLAYCLLVFVPPSECYGKVNFSFIDIEFEFCKTLYVVTYFKVYLVVIKLNNLLVTRRASNLEVGGSKNGDVVSRSRIFTCGANMNITDLSGITVNS
uniref:Uncharacterized protein n=1 Tax=Cacopsylla melanoneura TaxID=428564 RepID=A0A8D9AIZ7_9HEMI